MGERLKSGVMATGPIVWVGVAASVVLTVLVASGLLLRSLVASSFASEANLRAIAQLTAQIVQHQLDEETGLRGFNATHGRVFLEPYDIARQLLPGDFDRLQARLEASNLPAAADALDDARTTNQRWLHSVAEPLISGRAHDPVAAQIHGKELVDRFRLDARAINDELAIEQQNVDQGAGATIDRITIFVIVAIVGVALAALVVVRQRLALAREVQEKQREAALQRERTIELESAYLAEKRIADKLQDAIAQRPLPALPRLQFSATYVPATEDARVGGDWYDVIELPGDSVLFAIGDVAGHGLDAAVTMSRARQALIASALVNADPAAVLARVNTELLRQGTPMVTAVTGFANARTFEFVYASAGHPPPLLIERNREPRMLAFGGIPLGVQRDATFTTHRVQSMPGATLVLYTDGAIEHSKNVVEGETLLIASAARAAGEPGANVASIIHNDIFHGSPAGDDVAILTIGFTTDGPQSLRVSADRAQSTFSGQVVRATDDGDPSVSSLVPIDAAATRRRRILKAAS